MQVIPYYSIGIGMIKVVYLKDEAKKKKATLMDTSPVLSYMNYLRETPLSTLIHMLLGIPSTTPFLMHSISNSSLQSRSSIFVCSFTDPSY